MIARQQMEFIVLKNSFLSGGRSRPSGRMPKIQKRQQHCFPKSTWQEINAFFMQKTRAMFSCLHLMTELVRPFQFNYLSYKLFLEKKSCQTPKKKKKKSHLWCLTDESGFEIFCQTPKKKKKKCKF